MADPKDIAQQQVQRNWPRFGKIRVSCTYYSVGTDSYNTDTRGVTKGAEITIPGLMVIFDSFNQTSSKSPYMRKDDVEILSIDKIAMFPFLDLVDSGSQIIAKVDDQLNDSTTNWLVKGLISDPADALVSLHVRPTK